MFFFPGKGGFEHRLLKRLTQSSLEVECLSHAMLYLRCVVISLRMAARNLLSCNAGKYTYPYCSFFTYTSRAQSYSCLKPCQVDPHCGSLHEMRPPQPKPSRSGRRKGWAAGIVALKRRIAATVPRPRPQGPLTASSRIRTQPPLSLGAVDFTRLVLSQQQTGRDSHHLAMGENPSHTPK